jgi:hypothetical protein
MRQEGEDRLWWIPSKRGLFGVKSFYNVMGCHDGFCFPWKSVWRTEVIRIFLFFFGGVGGSRKDAYHRQSPEATCHCG